MGTQVVTRAELELYDLMKCVSGLMFIMSMLVVAMGKCGMRTVWREKSKVGHRVTKKSAIIVAFIAFFGMWLKKEGQKIHEIKHLYKKQDSTEDFYGEDDEFVPAKHGKKHHRSFDN